MNCVRVTRDHQEKRVYTVYMKRVIIFDFDGVIVDSWKHSYEMNLRNWPNLKPEQHKTFFNGNIHEEIAKLGPSVQSQEERDAWMSEVYFPTKINLPIFMGIDAVIKNLYSLGYTLVINTSADTESTKKFLIKNKIDCFDAVYGTEISKDKKVKFEKILDHYEVCGADVLFITDTVGDVLDAKDFGMRTILVTYGYQDESFFSGMEKFVEGFVNSPEEIIPYLN